VTLVCGLLALVTGVAYTLLGAIAAYELGRHSSRRGFSHFGAAFMVMAFTCGPHHLVHAVHLLLEGERATWQLTAAMVLGVAPAVAFVGLRAEAMLGGRGDRLLRGDPPLLLAAPWLITFLSGVVLAASVQRAVTHGASAWLLAPNVVLFVNYVVVGVLVRRTQVARRPLLGGWSLSGVGMAGVFPTCGVSHLTAGFVVAPDWHMLLFDLPGVPASLVFLWVVHKVHTRSLADWNRRPLVGRASATSRPSPWAPAAAVD
jgi:hypothetical protein